MKKLIYSPLLLFGLLQFNSLIAQELAFPIKNTILHNANPRSIHRLDFKDTLKETDYYFKERYWHFYRIKLVAGEQLNVTYGSDKYAVAMIMGDSAGHGLFMKQDSSVTLVGSSSYTQFLVPVNKTGEYLIELSTNAPKLTGRYALQVNVAGPEMLTVPKDPKNFMDNFYFLSEHAKSRYIFILGEEVENKEKAELDRHFTAPISIIGSTPGIFVFHDGSLGNYYSQRDLYRGTDLAQAKKKFEECAKIIKAKVPEDWEIKSALSELTGLPEFSAEDVDVYGMIQLEIKKNRDGTYSVNLNI